MRCEDCDIKDSEIYESCDEVANVNQYGNIILCDYCAEHRADYEDSIKTFSSIDRWIIAGY